MHKVLLVEDDIRLAELVSEYLVRYGFRITTVPRGDLALPAIEREKPDAVILDLMLPGMDGMDVCRQIRRQSALPVLMLTARRDLVDQVAGLELGADDYMLKPVEPRLLLARLRAILRRVESLPTPRAAAQGHQVVRYGQLEIDRAARRFCWRGAEVELKTAEYKLLFIMFNAAGAVLSRDDIMRQWRGIDFDGVDRRIDNCISRLRRLFDDDPNEPRKLKTVRGCGYLFNPLAWD